MVLWKCMWYCGKMAEWIGMPLGMVVRVGPGIGMLKFGGDHQMGMGSTGVATGRHVNNLSDVRACGKRPHSLMAKDYLIIFSICLSLGLHYVIHQKLCNIHRHQIGFLLTVLLTYGIVCQTALAVEEGLRAKNLHIYSGYPNSTPSSFSTVFIYSMQLIRKWRNMR